MVKYSRQSEKNSMQEFKRPYEMSLLYKTKTVFKDMFTLELIFILKRKTPTPMTLNTGLNKQKVINKSMKYVCCLNIKALPIIKFQKDNFLSVCFRSRINNTPLDQMQIIFPTSSMLLTNRCKHY